MQRNYFIVVLIFFIFFVISFLTNIIGPLIPDEPYCRVYGAVGRIVNTHKWAYLNINEPPISRTLMGYITERDLGDKLPKTFAMLKETID